MDRFNAVYDVMKFCSTNFGSSAAIIVNDLDDMECYGDLCEMYLIARYEGYTCRRKPYREYTFGAKSHIIIRPAGEKGEMIRGFRFDRVLDATYGEVPAEMIKQLSWSSSHPVKYVQVGASEENADGYPVEEG